MWRVNWRCYRHKMPWVSVIMQYDRSPHTFTPLPPECPDCSKMMIMGPVEDLRPKVKVARQRGTPQSGTLF